MPFARCLPAAVFTLGAGFCPTFAQNVRLNSPLIRSVPGGPIVGDVHYSFPIGEGLVVYGADQDVDQITEIYTARLDGSGTPRRLTAALGTTGVAYPLGVSPDGSWLVCEHFPLLDPHRRLLAVPTRGAAVPVLLDEASDFALPIAFGADGSRVVYRRRPGLGSIAYELYSVPLDASQPPVALHPPWPSFTHDWTVAELQVTPDGTEALFRADPERWGKMVLFAAPVDGSALPRRLSADLHDVQRFSVSPDGLTVVYEEGRNLFTASLGRARPPERLSDVRPDGALAEVRFTSDGRTVVFNARRGIYGRYRLYSALADGGRPPHGVPGGALRRDPVLLTPLGLDNEVLPGSLQLTPDGAQAVYLADAVTDGRYELYRVPTNGSGAPVPLDAFVEPDEQLLDFALAPDGGHVVYRTGSPSGANELYAVPLVGGPAFKYGTRSLAGVPVFRVAPDSSFVFFLGESDATGAHELFAVPIDASRAPRRLNSPLPPGGNVAWDFVPLSGGRVVYIADQREDDVAELFEGFTGRALPAPR